MKTLTGRWIEVFAALMCGVTAVFSWVNGQYGVAVIAGVCSGLIAGDLDVRQATELGAALIYDKPILLVIPKGRTIGAHLRRAADVVIDDWDASDPAAQERMLEGMKRLGLG